VLAIHGRHEKTELALGEDVRVRFAESGIARDDDGIQVAASQMALEYRAARGPDLDREVRKFALELGQEVRKMIHRDRFVHAESKLGAFGGRRCPVHRA